MSARGVRKCGWILSLLISAFLIGASAVPKFTDWEGKEQMFDKLGYGAGLMVRIGVVEIAAALLFVIPRTGLIGAILLTAYLGGATSTHVRVGDPFYFPIVFGVLVWIALGLRHSEVFALAFRPNRSRSTDARQ